MARKRLGEILMAAGVLDEAKLRAALAEQRRWGGHLGRILVDMKALSEDTMVAALAHQLTFPTVNLDQRQIPLDVLDLVPAELAQQYSVVPFQVQGKFLDVAMADPTNLGIIDELRIRTRLNVRPHLAGPRMIERALSRVYGRGTSIDIRDSIELGSAGLSLDTGAVSDPVPLSPSAAQRRAQGFELATPSPPAAPSERDREVASLQARVQHLEALVARDEDVLRKLMGLLIEKGLASREEILERLSS